MPKLIRITTVPISLQILLKGQMRFMKEHGFEVIMISNDGPEVKPLLEQEQCPHIAVRMTRIISPFTDLVSLFKLIKLFRKLKPDIVHSHTPKAGLLAMWAAKFTGVPVRLHTIAGLPWVETKGWMNALLQLVEKLTALPAHRIYPNSFIQQQFLSDHKIAVGKMKVLGNGSSNGINSHFFSLDENISKISDELKRSEKVPEDGWIWIFVGRIVKDKGIGELVEAFAALHKIFPSDRLWLVGEEETELDPLDEEHKKILHEHSAIRCWGFQKDIRPYLASARVLVFPSYREGFPNVPLQAGSMGCMLLLSDINGCNEIVQDGVNGMLVPPKDREKLTGAMITIRKDENLRKAFAASIQKKIREDYDQQKLWNILLEEYRFWLAKN